MNSLRLYTLTASIHPWLYLAHNGVQDSQVKHALDRLLREIESDVEWYVSYEMERHFHTLKDSVGLDAINYIEKYEGGSLATTGVSKIRIAGKKINLWQTSSKNFPSVEHVKPISDCWKFLLRAHGELYALRWEDLSKAQRLEAQAALRSLGLVAPVCLITRYENKRLKKNGRGPDPWASYMKPKDGGLPIIVRKIRGHKLPALL